MQTRNKLVNLGGLLCLAFVLLATLATCSKMRNEHTFQVHGGHAEASSWRQKRHFQVGQNEAALAQLARPANQPPANSSSSSSNNNNVWWQSYLHPHHHQHHHNHQDHLQQQQQQQQQAQSEEDDQANGKPAASKFTLANTNRTNHQREPHMKHACENNQLELTCQEGKLIHMARATYGRFSLSVCNELGHTNLSVQCASFRAFLIMETRCNKLNNCTVTVSKELFGDPCEGTSKYLEVQYYCHDANNNNNNNNNNNQQQQSAPSSTQPQISFGGSLLTTATANRPPFNGNPSGQQVTGAPGGGGHKSPAQDQQVGGGELSVGKTVATGTNSDELLSEQQQSHATNVIQQQQQQQQPQPSHLYCEPQTSSRKLYWNYTRAGQFARQNCPEGSFGRASWYCDAERFHFRPAWSPDFSQCKTIWLQRLADQLDKLLESPNKQQLAGASSGPVRQQNEQNLRNLLNDLDILVHSKDLFSEDLKRIDIMIGQIIAQQRSLSVSSMSILSSAGENNWPTAVPYDSIYEDLFSRLVSVVSALFEVSQRAAWLEVQPAESRRKLEQRFLGHLKESGAMLASFMSNNHQLDQQAFSRRQPNVFAAITVIKRFNINNSSLDYNLNLDELNNFQAASSPGASQTNRLVPTAREFEVHSSVAKELLANGVTRLLVLDIIKPDYSHIRQQLDFYQGGSNVVANEAPFEINLFDIQQSVSRVFGVFAVVGESGDILDGNDDSQREHRLAELLGQRPISVDFKVPQPASQQQQQQQVVRRQCNSLQDGGATSQTTNRCQTFRSNATNQICRCDRFGFLALSVNAPPDRMLQVPFVAGADFQWPGQPAVAQPASDMAAPAYGELDVTSGNRLDQGSADYIKPAQGKQQQQQQQALGFWTTSFIVIGLILFVLSLAGLIASATLRANGQSRLNKKQQHFLTGGATPGSMLAHQRDLSSSGQTTTGPLTDHSLLSEEQLIAAGAINNNNNNNNNSSNIAGNHSATSVMGLAAQSAVTYHEPGVCYKAAQQQHQLYAAHLPHMSGSLGRSANRWPRWTDWLRPSRWLSQNGGHSKELMIQHRVIGNSSLASAGSLAAHYKGQYQNGYTTNLHHSPALAQMPLAAPSSSTSSYVSSSAYYEEIGPGNLTRLSTSQLTSGAPRHTVVDPFKPRQAAADQQQLVSHTNQHPGGHVLHHSLAHWATHSASTSSPQDSQQQPANLATANYGQPLLNNSAYNKQQFHTDLSQLQTGNNNSQSSSSSAGSQHSASTNITTANGGSTPRHYLFASPSAVSAYKSSMSQYPTAYQ